MAVSAADMNTIRVSVLGSSVDQATTWTTMPPGAANTLGGDERIINRAINALRTSVTNAMGGTNGFNDRFSAIVGEETTTDQAAFASIGSNLIQAVALLMAGGGVTPQPQTVLFEFIFPDPLNDGDFVEEVVSEDVTIPANFTDSEYRGTPVGENILFELTLEPAGTVIGTMTVDAGGDTIAFSASPETPLTAGDTLRLTAVVANSVTPDAQITIAATKKAVAPDTGAGRYVHEQTTPSNAWVIDHDLGFAHVLPQIVSDSGNTILADITYLSNDSCRLNFAQAVSGTAILRR